MVCPIDAQESATPELCAFPHPALFVLGLTKTAIRYLPLAVAILAGTAYADDPTPLEERVAVHRAERKSAKAQRLETWEERHHANMKWSLGYYRPYRSLDGTTVDVGVFVDYIQGPNVVTIQNLQHETVVLHYGSLDADTRRHIGRCHRMMRSLTQPRN